MEEHSSSAKLVVLVGGVIVINAINRNLKTLLRRGRGYKNLGYLLLKAQRMAVTKTEFIVLQKAA